MQQTVEPHSKIGVVSGAMGIGMFLIFLKGIIAYYFQIRQGSGPNSEVLADLQLMIVWLLPVPVHIIGLILGVVSLFFPNRKKTVSDTWSCRKFDFWFNRRFPLAVVGDRGNGQSLIKPPFQQSNMKVCFYIFALVVCFAGCNRVNYRYSGEDKKIHYDMNVPIGKTNASYGFGIVTAPEYPLFQNGYPTIVAFYGSDSNEVNNLKQLDVKLFVDGKEIQPDIEEFSAEYISTYLAIDKKECCADLGERLGIDPKAKNDPFRFCVRVNKSYKSLKTLPPQVTVVLSATSDKGTVETTEVLNLSSYEDNSFIRVH